VISTGTAATPPPAVAPAAVAPVAPAMPPPGPAAPANGMPPLPNPTVADPLAGTTARPWQRIAGPIIGGVVGAGALAGVIAVSIMKQKTTTPAAPTFMAKEIITTPAPVVPIGTTTPVLAGEPVADAELSSGMTQTTVLALACGLVVCGLCVCIIVAAMYCCGNKKKRARKMPPTRETPNVVPEDQEPMMGTRMDMDQSGLDLNASQYMPVNLPPLTPGYAGGVGIGSIPTMTNVVPMQTMPPPPPQLGFSQPATLNYGLQQASPLANTVNVLPATAFSNMQMPQGSYAMPQGSYAGGMPQGSYQMPPTYFG